MSEIGHRSVETNGIRMHIAEQGAGPLVVLCHGFPESWYSWRHQLPALADGGLPCGGARHARLRPDRPARGDRSVHAPPPRRRHGGPARCLGEESAVIAGHDWGAPVAWHAALLRPDRFRAVVGLSVPFRPRGAVRPTTVMPQTDDALFYQLYFQEPGVAEAELERDVRLTHPPPPVLGLRGRRRGAPTISNPDAVGMVPRRGGFLSAHRGAERPAVMAHRGGSRLLRRGVRPHGVPRRTELVPQHRPQLGAARALRGRARDRPRAVRRRRSRSGGRVPRHGPAPPEPVEVRSPAQEDAHAPRLRALDSAGTPPGSQYGHGRFPQKPVVGRPSMPTGRLIILNGGSSAGKTSLGRAMQDLLPDCHRHAGGTAAARGRPTPTPRPRGRHDELAPTLAVCPSPTAFATLRARLA